MTSPYLEVVGRCVSSIEARLRHSLSLEDIAARTRLSKYHLHRVFRALTGLRLMDYVRRRKLAASLEMLLESRLRVVDIAIEFGFAYPQGYIRAFTQAFGMSPQQYRTLRPTVPVTPPLDLSGLTAIGETGLLSPPQMVMKPGFRLTGVRHRVDLALNRRESTVTGLAIAFHDGARALIGDPVDPDLYCGLVVHSGQPDFNWYLTATRTRGEAPTPPGMEVFHVGTHTWASFAYVAPVHPRRITWPDVEQLYDTVFGRWLPASGYQLAAGYHLEEVRLGDCREDHGELHLEVPVVRDSKI